MKHDGQVFAAKPRYEILDGLRGVAALMVVAFHLLEVYSGGNHFKQILNHGYLAVDFFFVLSGFVIGYAYDDRWAKGMTTWGFFRRRLIRLHPLVILGTLFGAALFYFQDGSPDWAGISQVSVGKLILVTLVCLTMIPCGKTLDIRGWGETNPLNGPVWSLQWEYLANFLYGTVIRRFRTWALAAFVALSAVLTLTLCLNIDFMGWLATRDYAAYTVIGGWSLTPDQLQIGLTRLLYPFFAGLLLSRLNWRIPVRRNGFVLCSFLVIAALAMPCLGTEAKPLANGIYEAIVILLVFPFIVALGAGSATPLGWLGRICRFSGEISFPIYIMHFPLVYMQASWANAHPNASAGQCWAVGVSMFALAIVTAYAALRLYDLPVRKWLSRK